LRVCLYILVEFLDGRGQPGDSERALRYYTRSL
jgi:hypothetical protein